MKVLTHMVKSKFNIKDWSKIVVIPVWSTIKILLTIFLTLIPSINLSKHLSDVIDRGMSQDNIYISEKLKSLLAGFIVNVILFIINVRQFNSEQKFFNKTYKTITIISLIYRVIASVVYLATVIYTYIYINNKPSDRVKLNLKILFNILIWLSGISIIITIINTYIGAHIRWLEIEQEML